MEKQSLALGHVAITGGCGFLGGCLVSLLLARNAVSRISVLDIKTSTNRVDDKKVSYHNSDITDLEGLRSLLRTLNPDVLIHTAASLPFASPDLINKINTTGTDNVLQASQEAGVKAFVYTSSASVIVGRTNDIPNADESWPALTGDDQLEYYSRTKALAENAVIDANRATPNFLTCAIRPAGIFGEGDTTCIPRLLLVSLREQTRFQIGSNNNLFDFTHVENVAWAHILAAHALMQTSKLSTAPLDTEKVDGESFFVTNDSPVYFWNFCRQVWKEAGDENALDISKAIVLGAQLAMFFATVAELILAPFGIKPNFNRISVRNSAMTRYFCINKAKERLGYQPIVTLEDGIRRGVREVVQRDPRFTEIKARMEKRTKQH